MRDDTMKVSPDKRQDQTKKKKWSKSARIGLAIGVLGAGAYAAADEALVLSTEHAVLSANVVVLRTPIDGEVAVLTARAGETVKRGQSLGSVRNLRVDTQRLEDINAQVLRVTGEEASLMEARASLQGIQADLASRIDLYAKFAETLFSERLEEAQRLSAAAAARATRLDKERGRRETLRKQGLTPDAEFERAAAEALASAEELAAANARIGATRVQRDGAQSNVFVDMGSHGASYPQQRLDEVVLRIAELDQLIGARRAELVAARARLAAEEARVSLLRRFDVTAPGAGMVWRVTATPGEQTPANGPLIELVDCNEAFLIAAAPQARVARMAVGDPVSYRLAGEKGERTGRISAILGSEWAEGERFAATPSRPAGAAAMVRITPDRDGRSGACEVGRSARVIFASGSGGWRGLITDFVEKAANRAERADPGLRHTFSG